ncbi:hypothetical protein C8R45DRAFT_944359 [Mycena sanguinolenta]|nr:hypothetical protein C8R45DRAFT_944359 [Mycena sanguinolenta]
MCHSVTNTLSSRHHHPPTCRWRTLRECCEGLGDGSSFNSTAQAPSHGAVVNAKDRNSKQLTQPCKRKGHVSQHSIHSATRAAHRSVRVLSRITACFQGPGWSRKSTEIRAGNARRMAGRRARPREETRRGKAMVMGDDNVHYAWARILFIPCGSERHKEAHWDPITTRIAIAIRKPRGYNSKRCPKNAWARPMRFVEVADVEIMNPSFSSKSARAAVPLIQETARKLVDRWESLGYPGNTIDISRTLNHAALDLIGDAILGYSFNALTGAERASEAAENTDVGFFTSIDAKSSSVFEISQDDGRDNTGSGIDQTFVGRLVQGNGVPEEELGVHLRCNPRSFV